ncbi:CLUMA_CG013242, isoform A [Clunio marinus]|uniref:CLUMA_CG013242, isoform A n=1 Tax=Clunio marinus TaxID=568069 RepID=A0A1J1II53_9DIPT|nr:CLUMA_CG013242, isoform A [Clunio marinus]
MFKFSSKKLEDPPKVMTMQEIQEDLETFCHTKLKVNRTQVADDLKHSEDIDNLSLNQWWGCFEANKLQIENMEKIKANLNEVKDEVSQQKDDVESKRNALLQEIQDNLERIQKLKSPK